MRILIAEDDFTSRLALAGVLKKNGHEVVETINGAAAWAALQQPDAPRLAILDWEMPEMDGIEVLRRVRALPTDHPPYIILLTSKEEKADVIIGLDSGANDYLVKPFDSGELRARVEVGRRMVEMQDALIESKDILAYQATHDPLTGLLNRRAIFEHLRKELARASRCSNWLAVGICDIDHFKRINDTHGHQAGDEALSGFARMLKAHTREYDSAGRIGGEEFLIITPVPAGTDCIALFDRLCQRVAASRIPTKSGALSLTLSIGVACTASGNTVDEIVEAADTALYRAKNEGRNRVAHDRQCFSGGNRACVS
jgi:diguanylate cyclase (GGDEF)-like protein